MWNPSIEHLPMKLRNTPIEGIEKIIIILAMFCFVRHSARRFVHGF